MSSLLEQVEFTLDTFEQLGIAVFPAAPGTKGTKVNGWPAMPASHAIALSRTAARRNGGRVNLAARTGPASDGQVYAALDVDLGRSPYEGGHPLESAREAFGEGLVAAVKTPRGIHIWVRTSSAFGNLYGVGGEIFCVNNRGRGHLLNLPPSMHPSGVLYSWYEVLDAAR
jgi:hypothetical protein